MSNIYTNYQLRRIAKALEKANGDEGVAGPLDDPGSIFVSIVLYIKRIVLAIIVINLIIKAIQLLHHYGVIDALALTGGAA